MPSSVGLAMKPAYGHTYTLLPADIDAILEGKKYLPRCFSVFFVLWSVHAFACHARTPAIPADGGKPILSPAE